MRKTFIEGIALGLLLATLVPLCFALFFDLRLFGNDSDSYIQTFLTSIVAIGAAYLALRGIRDQIQQNFEIEETRRGQSLRSARASLPLALSDLVTTARDVLAAIVDGTAASPETLVRPIHSPSVLDTISKCIEYSDNQSAERLAQIIRYIQLVRARFDPNHFVGPYPLHSQDWALVGHSRTSYIIDWATLVAICDSSFAFSRGSVPRIPAAIEIEQLRNSLTTAHIFLEDYPLLNEVIEARAADGRLERNFSQP